MRVALGQLDMVWEDKEHSYKKAEKMAEEAAASECDIIIFPEMSLTGFSMNLKKIGEDEKNSETVEKMQNLAQRLHMAIGFGWAALGKNPEDKGTNRFTLMESSGRKLVDYVKLHPFSYGQENRYY